MRDGEREEGVRGCLRPTGAETGSTVGGRRANLGITKAQVPQDHSMRKITASHYLEALGSYQVFIILGQLNHRISENSFFFLFLIADILNPKLLECQNPGQFTLLVMRLCTRCSVLCTHYVLLSP